MSPAATAETTKAAAGGKLSLPLKTLQKAMGAVIPAVERKTTIPALGNVRIEKTEGSIEFSATNLNLGIRITLPAGDTKAVPAFLLPALRTESYVKLLEGDEVSLSFVDDRRAVLRCGRSNTKLPMQSVSNFPLIATGTGDVAVGVEQEALLRALKFVTTCISTEESRYIVGGCLMEIADGKLFLVATDGHRLAKYKLDTTADARSCLLPAELLAAVKGALRGGDSIVSIEIGDEAVFARIADDSGKLEISCRKLVATFPNYEAVMPQKTAAILKVDAELTTAALRRCLSFTDERSGAVKFTVSPESIGLKSASSEHGETQETIDVISADVFEPFGIGFNAEYLVDVLGKLRGEVQLRFSALDGNNAMLVLAEPAEGETLEYVIMPLRV